MSLLSAKQIDKLQQAFVGFSGFSAAGGTSDNVTSAISSALATAGNLGNSVPVQVGSGTQEGINTTAGFNLCTLYSSTTGLRLTDGSGNDVYAKISNSGSTWTLSYFTAPGGTEAPYAMPASTALSVEFPYVFTFDHLPYTAGTATTDRHVAPDLSTVQGRLAADLLTVTATNTLSDLSQTFKGPVIWLSINGKTEDNIGGSAAFSVSGKTVTWNASNAKYALSTDMRVVAYYNY